MKKEEFDIVEEAYFVTGYEELKNKVDLTTDVFNNTLVSLLKKGWVDQLNFNQLANDFEKNSVYREELDQYSYLATKEGLLKHNGMKGC